MLSCATKVRTIGLGRELWECGGVEANNIESELTNKDPISLASPQYWLAFTGDFPCHALTSSRPSIIESVPEALLVMFMTDFHTTSTK